jgi:hypothetical protein
VTWNSIVTRLAVPSGSLAIGSSRDGVLQPLEEVVAERLPEPGLDHHGQVLGFHVGEAGEHHVRDRLVEVPFPGLLGGEGGEDAGEQHGDDHGAAEIGHAAGSLSEALHQ